MHFGKHEGEKLGNIPARYLLYIRAKYDLNDNLKAYIDKNKKALEAEVKRANKQMYR
jgi:hypothetical protein